MHHEGAIEANRETLLRCTQVDDCLVLCLWSGDAINEATKSRLEAESSMHHRCVYLYEWLQQQNHSDTYLQFLRIMDNNDQRHVTNLLRNSLEGVHVPLSAERFARMRRLVPDLLFMIYNSEELVSMLQATRALTRVDCEELRMDRTNCKKNSMLINAILRRSDHSFEQLREALIRTQQEHIAEALVQGEIVRVHLETNRPELDAVLSEAMNSRQQRGSLFDGLHSLGIHIVRCRPDHSILAYFYCKTPQHMIQFTKHFDSHELKFKMIDILNRLLKIIRPKEKQEIEATLRLEDEDVARIRAFTGLENWTGADQTRTPTSGPRQKPQISVFGSTHRPEPKATGTQKQDKRTGQQQGRTTKGSLPSKSSEKAAASASSEFEFLTTEVECLMLEAKLQQLEAEMKRKETEWTKERQELNDKLKEAEEEKQKSEHYRFEIGLLNLNSSRSNGKCRDENEKQTEFHRTV